jgi:hypothetical protein
VDTVHTVYLDNQVLELYHGRLYLRPHSQMLRVRWRGASGCGPSAAAAGGGGGDGDGSDGGCGQYYHGGIPAQVTVTRKVINEGWKGEAWREGRVG